MSAYVWKVGDVFTDGKNRWKVDSVQGGAAVVLDGLGDNQTAHLQRMARR
jgi:hypothetical protein